MAVNFDKLVSIIIDRGKKHRSITAIAGPPCSGKSTLAMDLYARINSYELNSADIFQMDGFHYDDIVLNDLGLLSKKGSPNTFDIPGFTFMLKRLFENREKSIAVPVFDRELEVSRNGSNIIEASVRHLIVEGNYLMLKEKPWSDLLKFYDTTIFINVSPNVIRERLEHRWKSLAEKVRRKRILDNDLPNANYIFRNSLDTEFLYENREN